MKYLIKSESNYSNINTRESSPIQTSIKNANSKNKSSSIKIKKEKEFFIEIIPMDKDDENEQEKSKIKSKVKKDQDKEKNTTGFFIAELLKDIVEENSHKSQDVKKIKFHTKNPPKKSLTKYIKRLIKYFEPEKSTLIISIIYIDKIFYQEKEKEENLFLTYNNIYKVFLTSLILAIKFNEDYLEDNEFFAKHGGISLKELNKLEREFLSFIDYNLFIDNDVYEIYEETLQKLEK